MGIKRHNPEEIVSKLRQVDVLVGQGMSRPDAIRQVSITEQTYYRWRKHAGMEFVVDMLGEKFDEAPKLASDLHREQSKKATTILYLAHLMAVSEIVLEANAYHPFGNIEDIAIGALLHDEIRKARRLAFLLNNFNKLASDH